MKASERAAEILEREAEGIRDGHTLDGRWNTLREEDRQAKRDHDEMLRIAAQLRQPEPTDDQIIDAFTGPLGPFFKNGKRVFFASVEGTDARAALIAAVRGLLPGDGNAV
jgi:hypothetical protein